MTADRLPLWARMACGYDDDPKIAALARFGEEAGLCRDLHLAMIRYSRRNETDGWVPPEEIGRLAWPLPVDRALVLVEHLAEVELVTGNGNGMTPAMASAIEPDMAGAMAPAMAGAMASAIAHGWHVVNYAKWQETRGEVEAYSNAQSERGRRGAEKRWKREPARRASSSGSMAGAERVLDGQARWRPDGDSMAESEVELELESSGSGRDAGAGARAREASPEDDHDDEELTQVQALMAAAGRPVSRQDAATIRATVLAKAGNVRNPRAFIGKVLGDPKQARGYAPGAVTHVPTAREIIDSSKRPGGPGDAGAGAAEARRLLAERTPAEPKPDEAPGLHGEALARRQLAEIASTRKPVDPPPDDDDDEPPGDEAEEQYPF
jgi:hypothetical protein